MKKLFNDYQARLDAVGFMKATETKNLKWMEMMTVSNNGYVKHFMELGKLGCGSTGFTYTTYNGKVETMYNFYE